MKPDAYQRLMGRLIKMDAGMLFSEIMVQRLHALASRDANNKLKARAKDEGKEGYIADSDAFNADREVLRIMNNVLFDKYGVRLTENRYSDGVD